MATEAPRITLDDLRQMYNDLASGHMTPDITLCGCRTCGGTCAACSKVVRAGETTYQSFDTGWVYCPECFHGN